MSTATSWSRMEQAVIDDNIQTLRVSLSYGESPYSRGVDGMTPVHLAAAFGRARIMKMFLNARRETCIAIADDDGWSALHYAMYNGHTEVVLMLLSAGADARKRDKHSVAPLDLAARQGCCSTIAHAVDKLATMYDAENLHALLKTALYIAAHHGIDTSVLTLLRYQFDYWGIVPGGTDTALHAAVRNGNTRVCRAIIVHCPETINVRDRHGHTPLYIAIAAPGPAADQTVDVLLCHAACDIVGVRDTYGLSPLAYARLVGASAYIQARLQCCTREA